MLWHSVPVDVRSPPTESGGSGHYTCCARTVCTACVFQGTVNMHVLDELVNYHCPYFRVFQGNMAIPHECIVSSSDAHSAQFV